MLPEHTPTNQFRAAMSSSWIPSDWSLDLIGLLFLADLPTIAHRTAITGTATLLDALILCPGMHRQQAAPDLSKGEYPACAAMTTGYVFRVENPATVLYMQRVGRTGHLTTLSVEDVKGERQGFTDFIWDTAMAGSPWATIAYSLTVASTSYVMLRLVQLNDWIGVRILGMLMLVRLINILIVRRRAAPGWKGAAEPGVKGDLIILMSQDRWIRIRGLVDDLKAVTSGEWLRESTPLESMSTTLATLLLFLDSALAMNVTHEGKMMLAILMFSSTALLGLANEVSAQLSMCGRLVKVQSGPKSYPRRLELAKELINQCGRKDWAIKMGMVNAEEVANVKTQNDGPLIM